MLHTVYSNYYEVLKAMLSANLKHESLGADLDCAFEQYRVIVPSLAVQDDLMRSMADERGVCAGVKFEFIGEWFKPLSGIDSAVDRTASSLVWYIWAELADESFVAEHPRLQNFFNAKSGVQRDMARYDLALRIAAVFKKYITYRLDWVLDWLGVPTQSSVAPSPRELREKAALQASDDFAWQKALWERLGRDGLWPETDGLRQLPDFFASDEWAHHVTRPVHIFMPFSVTPLLLPYLRKLTSEAVGADIWLYILNPCSQYWFEAVPKNLCDWSASDASSALPYLTRNAQSTRAMIDRLWLFTSEPEGNNEGLVDAVKETEPEQFPDFAFDQTVPIRTRSFDVVRDRLQELKLDADAHVENLFIDPGEGSLLAQAQHAVLTLDTSVLPEVVDPSDRSLRIIQAPNPVREVEALVDQLYEILKTPGIAPDDVLVVTPDIQAMAPIIDGVFNALPAKERIAWRIVGRSVLSENLSAQAVMDLGDMLAGRTSLTELEAWLELPIVTRHWNLSLSDLSVLRSWLAQAGFRYGLNAAHLAALGQSAEYDGCLDRALERLTCGFMLSSTPERLYGDTLPITGEAQNRFDTVVTRPDLLNTLLRLAKTLQTAYAELIGDGTPRTPAVWAEQIAGLMQACFGEEKDTEELTGVRRALRHLTRSMQDALGDERAIAFELYWHALKEQLSEKKSPGQTKGAVTFADIGHARGMAFKVIAVLGLNNDSSFPGFTLPEAFDLTALTEGGEALRRRGDRDSRQDNRNVFFNLLCSARERFIVSYCVGEGGARAQPKLPSPVVNDLLDFLMINAKDVDLKTSGRAARDAFEAAVTVRLPLLSYGAANFERTPSKYWRGHDRLLFDVVKSTIEQGGIRDEIVFADTRVGQGTAAESVSLDVLADFWHDPDKWTLKAADVGQVQLNTELELAVCPDADDHLAAYRRRTQILDWMKAGLSDEHILALMGGDPSNGACGVREWYGRSILAAIREQNERFESHVADWSVQDDPELRFAMTDAYALTGIEAGAQTVKWLTAPEGTVYRTLDGEEWLVEPLVRSRDKVGIKLRQLLRCASGSMTGSTIVLKKPNSSGKWYETGAPVDPVLAKRVLHALIAVWLMTVERRAALVYLGGGYPDDKEPGVLWRGLDVKRAQSWADRILAGMNAVLASKKKDVETTLNKMDEALEQMRAYVKELTQ